MNTQVRPQEYAPLIHRMELVDLDSMPTRQLHSRLAQLEARKASALWKIESFPESERKRVQQGYDYDIHRIQSRLRKMQPISDLRGRRALQIVTRENATAYLVSLGSGHEGGRDRWVQVATLEEARELRPVSKHGDIYATNTLGMIRHIMEWKDERRSPNSAMKSGWRFVDRDSLLDFAVAKISFPTNLMNH